VRLTFLLCSAAALIQAQSSSPPAGLEPQWDIAIVLQEISADSARLLPALDQVDPASWVAKGASDTYVAQWQSSKEQARAITDGAKALAKSPERLSLTLELFFRLEALERMLGSIGEGTRKYQGGTAAQALAAVYAEGGANRERFRGYMINLSVAREHQFDVMDKEAQGCRATLTAPNPPKSKGRKK